MSKRQALKYSHRASWLFGKPVLRYQNAGMAGWCKENSLSQWQKGGGWTANLYGGAQSGSNNWAAVYIPVNEMPVSEFTEAQWSYYMTGAQTFGVNIVLWVHDYEDFTKRAEITQLGNVSGLGKAAYWNSHILDKTTDQFFYYGENTTGTHLTAGATNLYGLDDFQADNLFKNWSIYRISFEYGWEASGTFADVWVAEVNLNGISVPLKPSVGDHIGGEVKTYTKWTVASSNTRADLIAPAAAKRIRVIAVNCLNTSTINSGFEVYFGTGASLWTNPASAIFFTYLAVPSAADKTFIASDHIVFPEGSQPVGAIGEVVSMRTGTVGIGGSASFLITYREE